MKRRLYISGGVLAVLLCLLVTATAFWPRRAGATKNVQTQPVQLKVIPYGPTQADIDAASLAVSRHADVQKFLRGTTNRLLSVELLDPENKGQQNLPPTRFRAIFYDYTNKRVITAEGEFKNLNTLQVSESFYQPMPSEEEFDAAVRTLKDSQQFGSSLRDNKLKPYRPMPPVISEENSNGHGDRIITVGLMENRDGTLQNEIVGVNLNNGKVVRFENHAPPSALASPQACGVPNAGQSTTSNGTAGQYQLTVSQNGTELWNLLVIRPSASSGASSKRSGIELRDVKYRGKSVLKRGHVPILNVKYVNGECGPYRDWQYQEGMFQTDPASTDPAPGIRISPTPGTTALENGTDTGNFRGVDIYVQGNETVLVTELEAGWYRYIMEWRLANDGTISPRFGFGATDNSCVCFAHNHHVYWRFDFDVVGTNNNVYISEKGKKFLTPMQTEAKVTRNFATNRRLIIQNGAGNEGYILSPNLTDSTADSFGVGDMWVLQYKSSGGNPTELEDGITCVTCSTAFIQIDPFVNGESVVNQDVVVWYGAHFLHADGGNLINPDRTGSANIISGEHVVGPDLRPIQW
jgi:hypothetical protein